MLFMLDDILGKRRDIEIVAEVVDEEIDGYRSPLDDRLASWNCVQILI